MSKAEEILDRELQEKEQLAQMWAKRGYNSMMIALLRELYRPDQIPDLWFIADLLEMKDKKSRGRPGDEKIVAGWKEQRAAFAVFDLIEKKGLTVNKAVIEAAQVLPMSESAIKKHYVHCLTTGVFDDPMPKTEI